MGTEQLGAVAAPGVRVRAPWTNGQLYPGQVTSVDGDKVSIKFDDGHEREDVTWKACQVGPADEVEPTVGLRVMANRRSAGFFPGRVGAVSKSKNKVEIKFDDGEERVVPWTACRLRDAPRTSYKRPQSLSDSLSYAGLTDSQLKPRAQPAHESALKWIGFAATLCLISAAMHGAGLITSGTYTLLDVTLKTWDWAAIIYPLCAISSVIWNMVHYDRKDSAAIAKAMGGFESNDASLRDMVSAVHARSGLGGEVPRVFVCVGIKFRGASYAIDALPARPDSPVDFHTGLHHPLGRTECLRGWYEGVRRRRDDGIARSPDAAGVARRVGSRDRPRPK